MNELTSHRPLGGCTPLGLLAWLVWLQAACAIHLRVSSGPATADISRSSSFACALPVFALRPASNLTLEFSGFGPIEPGRQAIARLALSRLNLSLEAPLRTTVSFTLPLDAIPPFSFIETVAIAVLAVGFDASKVVPEVHARTAAVTSRTRFRPLDYALLAMYAKAAPARPSGYATTRLMNGLIPVHYSSGVAQPVCPSSLLPPLSAASEQPIERGSKGLPEETAPKVGSKAGPSTITEEAAWQILLVSEGHGRTSGLELPLLSIALTQLSAALVIGVSALNTRYRRIRAIALTWWVACILVALVVGTELLTIAGDVPTQIFASALGAILAAVLLADLFGVCISSAKVSGALGALASALIFVLDRFLLVDFWPVDDALATLSMLALGKFVVIRHMKQALPALALLWLGFLALQLSAVFQFQSEEQLLHFGLFALCLQLPAVGGELGTYPCSAFTVWKAFPLMALSHFASRVDRSQGTCFYRLGMLAVLVAGLSVEVGFGSWVDAIPLQNYASVLLAIPLASAFLVWASYHRREEAVVVRGLFRDRMLDHLRLERHSMFSAEDLERRASDLGVIESYERASLLSRLSLGSGKAP